jgi:iron complex outermembrane receptor protein
MKWNLYPGANMSWNFSKIARWYASVNKSLRMPTFTDLYYSSPTNVGNPDLKPEEATVLESGIKLEQKGLTGHVSLFHRWGKNMIDWVRQPDETVWHAENLTKINTDGVEFAARINPKELFGKKTFIHSIDVSYAWMNQNKQSGIYASRYVLDYMKNKLDIGISHAIWNHVGANWQFSYQDRNGAYTRWTGTSYGEEVSYKPFWLADARLYWKRKGTNIYMGISNLLDKTYYDFGNLAQPGRWIRFGIIRQIDF